MDKLRMRFSKTGRAVYISHLDLMHTFQRAFARAGYSIRYSEGFNPHPYISILLPLSVGMSSSCEIMDFRIREDCDIAEMPERVTAALPEGIRVLEVYEPESKPDELKWLEVNGIFVYDTLPDLEAVKGFFRKEQIVIRKKSKRGMADFDIVSGIRYMELSEDKNTILLHAVVSAQNPTLNPDLLAEALRQLAPELTPVYASFHRAEVCDSQMKAFR